MSALESADTGDDLDATTSRTLTVIGRRIRQLRLRRKMTLQQLADASRLSASMLSLVERGRSSPSLASLVAIASALGIALADLISGEGHARRNPVTRFDEQPILETQDRVVRRLTIDDTAHGVFAFHSEYRPGVGTSMVSVPSPGPERAIYGIVLDGVLTVGVGDTDYTLRPGDSIAFSSHQSHRIWNESSEYARAVWINLRIGSNGDPSS